MARETKAQREERLEAEREAFRAEFLAQYQQRLTRVVFEFATLWSMPRVKRYDENSYVFMSEDTRNTWNSEWVLPDVLTNYREDVRDNLDTVESEVQYYKDFLAEQERKANVRAEARRKLNELLTAEERELLNL
jgi:AMMECR1 domain-containing protein